MGDSGRPSDARRDIEIAARAIRGSSWPGDMAEEMEQRANRLEQFAVSLDAADAVSEPTPPPDDDFIPITDEDYARQAVAMASLDETESRAAGEPLTPPRDAPFSNDDPIGRLANALESERAKSERLEGALRALDSLLRIWFEQDGETGLHRADSEGIYSGVGLCVECGGEWPCYVERTRDLLAESTPKEA